MPGTTPIFGWPYGLITDGPVDLLSVPDLALAAEATVSALTVPIVTTLPATGNDGDTVDFHVTYPSSNSILWRFRYDASEATAFKWAFVGGPPLFNKRDPSGTISPGGSNDWQTLAGTDQAGPAVTLPVDAYYDVKFGATIASPTNGQVAQVGVSQAGNNPGDDNTAENSNTNSAAVMGAWFPFDGNHTAGQSLRLMYRCSGSGGGTAVYKRRWISVFPVRAQP